MEEKCVDPATQYDIDKMVLDYLIFATTKNLLGNSEKREAHIRNAYSYSDVPTLLQLVDSYLTIFHAVHPHRCGDDDLRFRLRLLRFTIMFTSRLGSQETLPPTSALQRLRAKRQRQASSFRSHGDDVETPMLPDLAAFLESQDDLAIKQEQRHPKASPVLTNIANAQTQQASPPISLLDTLPDFMALSAAQTVIQGVTITDVWMKLAAGYMVQAAAEQYLVYRSKRPEVLQEAFAWGFDAECDARDGSDEWLINAMFFGENEVVNGWDGIRDEHMQALIPPDGNDLQSHLETLLEGELSMKKFEEYILSFLTGLHLSQPRPLLTQVESGNMDLLSRRQVRAFKKAVGLSSPEDS